MPSTLTQLRAISLEHKTRNNIVFGEENTLFTFYNIIKPDFSASEKTPRYAESHDFYVSRRASCPIDHEASVLLLQPKLPSEGGDPQPREFGTRPSPPVLYVRSKTWCSTHVLTRAGCVGIAWFTATTVQASELPSYSVRHFRPRNTTKY